MTNVETALNFISVIADITSAADEMFSTEISESIQVIADEEPDSTELAGTSEAASKGTTMLTRPSTGTIQRNQSSRIFIKRNRPFQITECPSLISEGKEKPPDEIAIEDAEKVPSDRIQQFYSAETQTERKRSIRLRKILLVDHSCLTNRTRPWNHQCGCQYRHK